MVRAGARLSFRVVLGCRWQVVVKWWSSLLPEAHPMVMRKVSKAVAKRLRLLGVDDVTDSKAVFAVLAYTPAGKRRKLLGTSSKVRKGGKLSVLTRVMYLAPARLSGANMCPWSTAGCAAACLGHRWASNKADLDKPLITKLRPDLHLINSGEPNNHFIRDCGVCE